MFSVRTLKCAAGNVAHYGQNTPPQYDLSSFPVPTALFSGGRDDLADPDDVKILLGMLPSDQVILSNYEAEYDHMDFVWGVNAYQKIYLQVIKTLQKYAN